MSPTGDLVTSVLFGYGYWGSKLARAIHSSQGIQLNIIVEPNPSRRHQAEVDYPHTRVLSEIDHESLRGVKLAFVSTPPSTHFDVGLALINRGISTVIAKPLTLSPDTDCRLKTAAKSQGVSLMVDYTYLFSDAVQTIQDLVANNEIGDPISFATNRSNLGTIQTDCNVIWDLAVHDFAILDFVLRPSTAKVVAVAQTDSPSLLPSTATISMTVDGARPITGSVYASWFSSLKVRTFLLVGTKGTIVFDDTASASKLRLVRGEVVTSVTHLLKASDKEERVVKYKLGDDVAFSLDPTETLMREVNYLTELITRRASNISLPTETLFLDSALNAGLIADACTRSNELSHSIQTVSLR